MAEAPAGSNSDTATAPPRVRPEPAEPARKPLPPHVVFLHNDEHNSEIFVVAVLRKVLGLDRSRATRLMSVAHRCGRSAVWSGHKELAELKATQIEAVGPDPLAVVMGEPCRPLKVTVEPAAAA